MDDLLDFEDDLLGDLDLSENDSSDDDLLGSGADLDDLLDFDEPEPKYSNNHARCSDMFILKGESKDPNDYIDEVAKFMKSGSALEDDIMGDCLSDTFMYWLKKYNQKLIPHDSFGANGVEPPKLKPSPFLASLAIQIVQQMRADAIRIVVSTVGERINSDVVTCDEANRKVNLAVKDGAGNTTLAWFDLDTGKALDSKHNAFSLT